MDMMKLRFLEGSSAGRTVEVKPQGVTIGRDPDCDLVFDDEGVSRRHARLYREGGRYVVEDLESTNGVRVNGQQIKQRAEVKLGDRIGIGGHVLLTTDGNDLVPPSQLPHGDGEDEKHLAPAGSHPTPAKSNNNVFYVLMALVVVAAAWVILMPPKRPPEPPAGIGADPGVPIPPSPPVRPVNPPPIHTVDGTDTGSFRVPSPDTAEDVGGYFWIASEPSGAEAEVDGTGVGRTPLIIHDMTAGVHSLALRKAGYRDLVRAFYIPHTGAFTPYKLKPADGTCLITSTPGNVTIWSGTQLLGTTPYLMSNLDPGEYTLRFTEYGYVPEQRVVKLAEYRAGSLHVELKTETGALNISTAPAGAKVFVDGTEKGVTTPGPDGGDSEPLLVQGLKAAQHRVQMEYQGRRTPPHTVQVTASVATPVRLAIWLPNVRVRSIDGKQYIGMLKEKNELGDVVLALSTRREVTLIATQIQELQRLTPHETTEILESMRPRQPAPGPAPEPTP